MEMFLASLPMVYMFRSLYVLQVCSNVNEFNNRNLFLTAIKVIKTRVEISYNSKASATGHIRTYILW